MRSASLLMLLSLAVVTAVAAPPSVVEVPRDKPGEWAEIKAPQGRLLVLGAEPASRWLLVDEDGADLRVFEAGKLAAFVAADKGRWKVIVTAPDGTPARVVVVVGDQPGPGPNPPKPPVDPLRAKLKAAFDADPDPKKSDRARDLAALYREAAKLTSSPEVATAGDLLQRVKAAAVSLVGADSLKAVRTVVGQELAILFPADTPLTDTHRERASTLFGKLATVLDTLAGG